MASKKYVGWGMAAEEEGQKYLVIVPAKSKKEACEKFRNLGFLIISKKKVRHVCVVKYPGPKDVQSLKAQNWNKGIRPIKQRSDELHGRI